MLIRIQARAVVMLLFLAPLLQQGRGVALAVERRGRESTGSGGSSSSGGDEAIIARLDRLCDKDKLVKLPGEVFKRIKKIHQQFVRDALRMNKSRARIEKIQSHITTLADDNLPVGIRPLRVSFECPELDQAVSSNALQATFVIPAGATFRKARQQLYMWYLAEDHKLQQRLHEKQRDKLSSATAFQQFVDSCSGPCQEQNQAIQALGFDAPSSLFPNSEPDAKHVATELYKKTVESLSAQLLQQKSQKAKSEEEKQKHMSKMALRDPRQQFGDAVEQTLVERG